MSMVAIQAKGLCKRYGNIVAVDNVDLEVKEGEIFAIVGPNGAGKTTLIKMILGITKPDSGFVELPDPARTGYLPENPLFYDNLTGLETLQFYASIRGIPKERCYEVLSIVGLEGVADRKVGSYSKGMVQRLALAQALLPKPLILVLDEPTSGLDPIAAKEFRSLIKEMREQGSAIIMSSHVLSEVEQLADRVGVLYRGRMVAVGDVPTLVEKRGLSAQLYVRIKNPSPKAVDTAIEYGGISAEIKGDLVSVACPIKRRFEVLRALDDEYGVVDFRVEEPGLEEVFVAYAGGKR
jgi:ABC-type multidrug transport system ATPase subunit